MSLIAVYAQLALLFHVAIKTLMVPTSLWLGDYRTWAPQWKQFTKQYDCISISCRFNYPNNNEMDTPNHSVIENAERFEDTAKAAKTFQKQTATPAMAKPPRTQPNIVIAASNSTNKLKRCKQGMH